MTDWHKDKRLIPALEFVQGHAAEAAHYLRNRFYADTLAALEHSTVESPIEAVFWTWWSVLLWSREIAEELFYLEPQRAVAVGEKAYRVDFAITPTDDFAKQADEASIQVPKIAIELDGHDFHERTKEQVAYRNERDRALQMDGWIVLHFSGSELNSRPRESVHGVYVEASDRYRRIEDAITDVQLDRHFASLRAATDSQGES